MSTWLPVALPIAHLVLTVVVLLENAKEGGDARGIAATGALSLDLALGIGGKPLEHRHQAVERIARSGDHNTVVEAAVGRYAAEMRFVKEKGGPDVFLCAVPPEIEALMDPDLRPGGGLRPRRRSRRRFFLPLSGAVTHRVRPALVRLREWSR